MSPPIWQCENSQRFWKSTTHFRNPFRQQSILKWSLSTALGDGMNVKLAWRRLWVLRGASQPLAPERSIKSCGLISVTHPKVSYAMC